MNTKISTATATPSRTLRYTSWGLRLLAAAAFLAAGGAKIAGAPMMVGIFDQIGIGQWFRIVTGIVEVVGGLGLLVTVVAGLSGLMLAVTMFVAVLIHLFVIGGTPIPAIILCLITAAIAWIYLRPAISRN